MTTKRPIIDMNLSAEEESNESRDDIEEYQLQKRRRYQRHTSDQIKRMEEFFIGCPHPNKMAREELGNELGLEPLQVKFWFQNKRAHAKAKQENRENRELQAENDKLRNENTKYRKAMENGRCYFCGCPIAFGEGVFDDYQLQMENARLREEFERLTLTTTKLFGKPITNFTIASSSSRNGKRKLE